MQSPIHIFTTGGTIDKVYFDANSDYQVGESPIKSLLDESYVTQSYKIQSVMKKDSLEITDNDRQRLVNVITNCPSSQIIITHGTDTMVDSAKFCQRIPNKTIVFTGSIQPARLRATDAPFNVASAFAAVQTLGPGVYIAMNGQIFNPDNVKKNYEAMTFEKISAQ